MRTDYRDTAAAAEYLGIGVSTLETYRVRGRGPAYFKPSPKRVLYSVADLDAWIAASRVVPADGAEVTA